MNITIPNISDISSSLNLLGITTNAFHSGITHQDVHSAFRRTSRQYHPDYIQRPHVMQCPTKVPMEPNTQINTCNINHNFNDLVYARDIVLYAINVRLEKQIPKDHPTFKNTMDMNIWHVYSQLGMKGLLMSVEKLMTKDRAYHGIFVRMAHIIGNPNFTLNVYSLVNKYYSNNLKMISLSTSLREMLDGLVRIWFSQDKGINIFVPLWHSLLLYEEHHIYFTISSNLNIPQNEICQYIQANKYEISIIKNINYTICPDSNNLQINVVVSKFNHLDPNLSSFHLKLANSKCVRVPLKSNGGCYEYPNSGLYAINDDDIFDISKQANVQVIVTINQ